MSLELPRWSSKLLAVALLMAVLGAREPLLANFMPEFLVAADVISPARSATAGIEK